MEIKFWQLIFVSAFALLIGACLVWGLGKQPAGETVCQIGVNQGLADISHIKTQIKNLDARITTLEQK
jgi:hypothetical protein